MHYVTAVSYGGGYRLNIRFEDDRTKVVDLAGYLDGPVFESLKDLVRGAEKGARRGRAS